MAKNTKLPMEDPNNLIIIGFDTQDGEEHELFDERALEPVDDNLVNNIIVYGVLQPITVREEGGKKYVVDGRQRVRAARKAKAKQKKAGEFEVKVPYTTHGVEGADAKILTGVMVSANEQRKADEILVKAAKASRLIAQGASIEECSIAFGRSVTTIRQWIKLNAAHPTLKEAVKAELVATSAAHEIAKYPKDEQVAVLNELRKQAGGDRVTEALAKAYRRDKGDSSASSATKATATGTTAKKAPASSKGRDSEQSKQNRKDGNPHLSPEAQALLDGEGSSVTPVVVPKGTKAQPRQAGIKRTWLRKALTTEAAAKLTEDQRKVLNWFATGLSEKGDWFDDFKFDVEVELTAASQKKAVAKETKADKAAK